MYENSQIFFTTGEFSRLCNVKKDTLFHYDEIGILQPEIVRENGYRYYSINQFFLFDIITMLKKAGASLGEIKEYIEHRSPEGLLELLKEKHAYLAREQQEIERMQRFIYNIEGRTYTGMEANCGVPRLEDCPEEYLIVVRIDPSEQGSTKNHMPKIRDHFRFCDENMVGDELPFGAIIARENVEKGWYKESWYFSRVNKQYDGERFYLKPRGTYAILEHKGSYESMDASYETLKAFIEEEGLRICGNAYEHELLSYFAVPDHSQYVIQICVQVEKRNKKSADAGAYEA